MLNIYKKTENFSITIVYVLKISKESRIHNLFLFRNFCDKSYKLRKKNNNKLKLREKKFRRLAFYGIIIKKIK